MEDINSDSTISSDARSTDAERLSKNEFPERYYGRSTTADGNIVDYEDLSPPESPGYWPVAPPRNNSDSTSPDAASPAAEKLSGKDSNSPTTRDLSPPVSPSYLPVSPPRNDSDSASSDPGKTLFPIAEEKKKRKLPAQEKDQNKQKFAHKYSAEEGRKKEQKLAAWMKSWGSNSRDDKFSHKHVAPNHDVAP